MMKTILLSQRKERDDLLAQSYISRHTTLSTDELLNSHLIKLITGPRRVGKSTQALLMLRNKNFAYLNFDKKELLDNWNADLVMRLLDEVYPNYDYLLLDEVQNLLHWDVWVTELFRQGKNMIITGSNANMLSSEMATVLTGKYLPIEMLPFSLAEFFEWHHLDLQAILPEQRTRCQSTKWTPSGGARLDRPRYSLRSLSASASKAAARISLGSASSPVASMMSFTVMESR